MPIKVVCDVCGEPHKVGDSRVGAKMRCRTCERSIKVPRGPYIEDDEELEEDEEEQEEQGPPDQEGSNVLPMVRDGAGAIVGLVLMGFYVVFTVKYLTGAEPPRRGSSSRSSSSRPSHVPSNPNQLSIPRNNFQRPNIPQPNVNRNPFTNRNQDQNRNPDPNPFPNPDPFPNGNPFPNRPGFPNRPNIPRPQRPNIPRPNIPRPNFPPGFGPNGTSLDRPVEESTTFVVVPHRWNDDGIS